MAKGKLYRGAGTRSRQLRAFGRRYGKRGRAVYGAVVGKVAREQAVARGEKVERVRPHRSHTRSGHTEHVRGHPARLEGERYGWGARHVRRVTGYWVPAHWSYSKAGKREWVAGHRVRGHSTHVTTLRLR